MALSVAAAYADRVARLAARGAQIIVLPEKMVGVTSDSADAVVKVLSDAARAAHATVIAGLSRNGVQPRRNMALVISQDGTLVLEYEKRYLVPMIETTFASGNTLGLFAGPEAQWGVAICKDLDFPAWSRAYGRRGVRLWQCPRGTLSGTPACTRGWRSCAASRTDLPSLVRPRRASSRSATPTAASWLNNPAPLIR